MVVFDKVVSHLFIMRHLSNEVPFERQSFITKIFDYLTVYYQDVC